MAGWTPWQWGRETRPVAAKRCRQTACGRPLVARRLMHCALRIRSHGTEAGPGPRSGEGRIGFRCGHAPVSPHFRLAGGSAPIHPRIRSILPVRGRPISDIPGHGPQALQAVQAVQAYARTLLTGSLQNLVAPERRLRLFLRALPTAVKGPPSTLAFPPLRIPKSAKRSGFTVSVSMQASISLRHRHCHCHRHRPCHCHGTRLGRVCMFQMPTTCARMA
jgi:hypothetical protein